MWTTILWIFGIFLLAWIIYNAWENIRFEQKVESAKRRRTASGVRVQSVGERMIGDWLHGHGISYDYDKPVTYSLREPPIRPDFVLPAQNVFIEFYGMMDDPNYVLHRKRKERIYEQKGWKVISVTPEDLPRLDALLSPLLNGGSKPPK